MSTVENFPKPKSSHYRVRIYLPNGAELVHQCEEAPTDAIIKTLREKAAQARRERPGLEFWGYKPRSPEKDAAKLWLACDPVLPPEAISLSTVSATFRGASLEVTQVIVRDAQTTTLRLVADTGKDTFRIEHILPLYREDGALVFELASVLYGSFYPLPVRVFYPPSLASLFWHYVDKQLHTGANIIGEHLLDKLLAADSNGVDDATLYTASVYCARYGTRQEADKLLDYAATRPAACGKLQEAVSLICCLIRAERTEGEISAADQRAASAILIGNNLSDLPHSVKELWYIFDRVGDTVGTASASDLANALATYRKWGMRLSGATSALAYESADLSGPAYKLPKPPADRRLAMEQVKRAPSSGLIPIFG